MHTFTYQRIEPIKIDGNVINNKYNCVILIENTPMGLPVTEQEATLIVSWLKGVTETDVQELEQTADKLRKQIGDSDDQC